MKTIREIREKAENFAKFCEKLKFLPLKKFYVHHIIYISHAILKYYQLNNWKYKQSIILVIIYITIKNWFLNKIFKFFKSGRKYQQNSILLKIRKKSWNFVWKSEKNYGILERGINLNKYGSENI